MILRSRVRLTALAIATLVGIHSAHGSVIFTAVETGGDVVFSGSGTLDISLGVIELDPINPLSARIKPDEYVLLGSGTRDGFFLSGFAGPALIGAGTTLVESTSQSGDVFGIDFSVAEGVVVPTGYVSGDLLSGSATFAGESFASLGITPGTYVWSWDTSTGTDSVTLQVVPEPTTLLLAIFGLVTFALVRCRR